MAFQLAKAYVEFSQKGIGGIMGGIGSLAGKLKSLVSPMGLVTAGLGALGAGAGVGGMLRLAAEAESLEVAFRTLLGSADKALSMMAQINEFAAKTPYEQVELAGVTKQLLAFGVAQENIIPTMRNLGDIGSLSGARMQDLAAIFGKVKGTGRLMTESLDQFLERGIPMTAELARMFGVAESQVRKLASEGKIGFSHMEQALGNLTAKGGLFYKGMEEQSKTLGGVWSTLTGNVKMMLAEVGKMIVDTFDLKTIATDMGSFVGNFQAYAEQIKAQLREIGDTVKSVGGLLFDMAKLSVEGWGMVADALGSFMGLLRGSSGETTGWFSSLIDNLLFTIANWDLFARIIGEYTYQTFANMWERVRVFFVNIGELLSWLWGNWRDVFKTIGDYVGTVFSNMIGNMREMWGSFWDWVNGGEYSPDLSNLTKGFESSIKRLPNLTKAEVEKGNKEIERLMKELGRREAAWQKRKAGGETVAADGTTDTGGTGQTAAGSAASGAATSSKDKFKFYGLAAFADQMQQAAAKQAESRQTMDLQRQQADATTRLADAAAGGGLKVTVTNAADLQPAY